MKNLIVSIVLLGSLSVNAAELLAYKDGSSNAITITDSSFESVFSSKSPACLKDGSKILGVNQAFKSMRLGYRDCSNGAANVRKQNAMGYKVTVIKLAELSDKKIKEILTKKN